MTQVTHTIKVPGKLYLAGEYAVVTPGHTAVLLTVNRYLTVQIEETDPVDAYVRSVNYSPDKYTWRYENDTFTFDDWPHPFHLVETVIQTVERYLKDLGYQFKYFAIDIKSQLDDNGIKIGLGSSGAVTIGVIRALLSLYDIKLSNEKIYKLAAIAHIFLNSSGSFGDLAACAYTGLIAYTSLDKEWLKAQLDGLNLAEILDEQWPDFKVDRLALPSDLKLLIGWTGSPASTESLVDHIYEKDRDIEGQEMDFQTFLDQSQACVETLIDGLENHNHNQVLDQLKINRTLLHHLSIARSKVIETSVLSQLCDIVVDYGGSAKSSGAGGGDCGIGLIRQNDYTHAIKEDWAKAGIRQLDLKIVQNGDDNSESK